MTHGKKAETQVQWDRAARRATKGGAVFRTNVGPWAFRILALILLTYVALRILYPDARLW